MRQVQRPGLMRAGCFVLLFLAANCLAAELQVFVSIAPQKFIVQSIGADTVAVEVMLPAGYSPELYEPLPRQLAALQMADVYFLIGVPFERQWQAGQRQSGRLRVVECCQQLVANDDDDPHIWNNPLNMRLHAEQIKHTLQALNPPQHVLYEENFIRLAAALDALNVYIARQLEGVDRTSFFVVHPAWGHLASAYGLTQYALERNHVPIGPRALTELIKLARAERASILFSQSTYHSAAARAFAREIEAEIVSLDPLAGDYINNMQYVAEQFARALR